MADLNLEAQISNKFQKITRLLVSKNKPLTALKLIKKNLILLGKKPLKIGIYDHALHFIGGGQRYGCQIASLLQENYEVTLITNKEISIQKLNEWYDINLNSCSLKIIPLPEFQKTPFVYTEIINNKNPFEIISKESLNYDIFINANMNPYVKPLSLLSIFICHFPDIPRNNFFEIDNYDYFITNSDFGSFWLKKNWGIDCDLRLYPGIDLPSSGSSKENIILSVARFEEGGSKKQLEMVENFKDILKTTKKAENWRLVLIGGSTGENKYLKKIKALSRPLKNKITVLENLPISEIKAYYKKAKIFWHLCGMGEERPNLMEHFGMTTVEALKNNCVPIVAKKGGQMEIVRDKSNGYLIDNLAELKTKTISLLNDENLLKSLRNKESSGLFTTKKFNENFLKFFQKILKTNHLL